MELDSQSLVSVIVPTYNSSKFLDACLQSVRSQTYSNIELIVVDNNSTDESMEIASKYSDKVVTHGPERSAQVNHGVELASGKYIYKVDSDFLLDRQVIDECIKKTRQGFDAVVVHNSPDNKVGWIARIRKFEVDMYKYDITHSSARFVNKQIFLRIGGFDENITAGEDYDFQNRLNRAGVKTGFIDAEALHLGEPKHFWHHMSKYFYYGKDFKYYREKNLLESKRQLKFLRSAYLKHWRRFVRHPFLAIAFAFYNICKFVAGGLGYAVAKSNK